MKQKFNGKIELLRLLFSIYILLFHGGKYLLGEASLDHGIRLSCFVHGSIGVEFFFVLSGFLMAASAFGRQEQLSALNTGVDTRRFMLNKIQSLFPYHVVAFVMTAASYILLQAYSWKDTIVYLSKSWPNLFFLQMLGFQGTFPNHIEWYISAMLIGMLFLYPLLLRHYHSFVNVIAPVASLSILGYFSYTTQSLTGVLTWTGLGYKGMFRCIAELMIGTVAFEVSRNLQASRLSRSWGRILTAAEWFCVVTTSVFVLFTFPRLYEFHALIMITALIILAFSGHTWHPQWMDRPLVKLIGKFTLPIYLCQICAVNSVDLLFADLSKVAQLIGYVVLTFVYAVICYILGTQIAKRLPAKRRDRAAAVSAHQS